MASQEENTEFMSVFPDIVRDLTEDDCYSDMPEVTKYFAQVLQYNVPKGKKIRGLAVVASYKILKSAENLTPENLRLANILGWCVEMLQAAALVWDDIMDESETRRGLPCWYRNKEVGLRAINDGVMLENAIYFIIRKYFCNHPNYVGILDLFHEVTFKSCLGQALDCMHLINEKPLDYFTMTRYNAIVKNKTGYYLFYLPVVLVLIFAGQFDEEISKQVKPILLEMGHFYQVQDDFLDCFGDTDLVGKTCTDIREGKCSWLIVVALERATSQQIQVLQKHYGVDSDESEKIVRGLYEELDLPSTYAVYEENSFNTIRKQILGISKELPHKLFFMLMLKIYKRKC